MFDLVYHGNFDYPSVYNMPVWLRKFYFKQLLDFKKAEKEAHEKGSKTSSTQTNAPPPGYNQQTGDRGYNS